MSFSLWESSLAPLKIIPKSKDPAVIKKYEESYKLSSGLSDARLSGGICGECKYFQPLKYANKQGAHYSCDAYPDGISDDVFCGKVVHIEPQGDDNGITFSLSEKYGSYEETINIISEIEIIPWMKKYTTILLDDAPFLIKCIWSHYFQTNGHCRGAMFNQDTPKITPKMAEVYDKWLNEKMLLITRECSKASVIVPEVEIVPLSKKKSSICILETYIAGTTHIPDFKNYEQDFVPQMKVILKREMNNKFDGWAIRCLDSFGHAIGYIPRTVNEIPARLMDGGMNLFGVLDCVEDNGKFVWWCISVYVEK